MTLKPLPLIITGLTCLITSCTTYYIPVDSFKQQLSNQGNTKLKTVTTKNPWEGKKTYDTYSIDSVRCVDKAGNPFMLKNSSSLEIRFTDNKNKKTTFYFDRITATQDSITGYQSRILSITKTIPFNTIKTIEIQDGQKKYSYKE